MITVLLWSDFMYDSNGDLKILEVNTNITLNVNDKVENTEDVFDFSHLQSFISERGFASIVYIGSLMELDTELKTFCESLSISYTFYNIGGNALTVPYVEDGDDVLIIRSAYDTTAIIDDSYCADKFNFVELISNETFGLPYALIDSNNTLVNTITEIPDNGVHPNFILKSRYPSYDFNVYPKLFKITSLAELDMVISENVTNEALLVPYLFNSNKLYNGTHIQAIRSYNILYPPTLESFSIGQYTAIGGNQIDNNPTYNSTTLELDSIHRNKYLTKQMDYDGYPKVRNTDKLLLADGTWASPDQIQIGTMLKTIKIPNPNGVDTADEFGDFNITLSDFNSGVSYTEDKVLGVEYVNTLNRLITITFTDGSTWADGQFVNFLCDINDDIRWKRADLLTPGDKLIALQDATTSTVFDTTKEVQSITLTTDFFTGWAITVENDHLWIVQDTTNNNNFALVEHNVSCSACTRLCSVQCPACPSKSQPACASAPAQAICTNQC